MAISRWALVGSVIAVALAALFCDKFMSPPEAPPPPARPDRPEPVAQDSRPASGAASTPSRPASTTAAPLPAQPVTMDRRRLYDAPDILAALDAVRHRGTPDEKDWGLTLATACRVLLQPMIEPLRQDDEAAEATSAPQADGPALAARKKQAHESLERRCSGFKDMNRDDDLALRRDLSDSGPKDATTLRRLSAMIPNSQAAWSDDQASLVTNALYSGDPALSHVAFSTLLSAIDGDAPGGDDRLRAMIFALGPQFAGEPTTEFERLDLCSSIGWCDANGGPPGAAAPLGASAQRLADAYRAAAANRSDVRALLAIH